MEAVNGLECKDGWISIQSAIAVSLRRSATVSTKRTAPPFSSHTTIHYETIDGRHVPKTICEKVHGVDGGSTRHNESVESCQFRPPPAKVFELATYGDFPLPNVTQEPSCRVHAFTWIAGGLTLLTLLLAGGLTWKSGRAGATAGLSSSADVSGRGR